MTEPEHDAAWWEARRAEQRAEDALMEQTYGPERAAKIHQLEGERHLNEWRARVMRLIGAPEDLNVTEALFASQAWLQEKLGLTATAEEDDICAAIYNLPDNGPLRAEVDPVHSWYALNAYRFHRRPESTEPAPELAPVPEATPAPAPASGGDRAKRYDADGLLLPDANGIYWGSREEMAALREAGRLPTPPKRRPVF